MVSPTAVRTTRFYPDLRATRQFSATNKYGNEGRQPFPSPACFKHAYPVNALTYYM